MSGSRLLAFLTAVAASSAFAADRPYSAPLFATLQSSQLIRPKLQYAPLTLPLPTTAPMVGGQPSMLSPYASLYASGYRPPPISIVQGPPPYNPCPLCPQPQYMLMPPPMFQQSINPMQLMLPMMMMNMFGSMGGGFGGFGSFGSFGGGHSFYSGGGYSGDVGDIPPTYSGRRAPGFSPYNEPGGLGADTSLVDTRSLSTRNCAQPRDDFQCMVCNCYFEAGNEPFTGKVEVNRVVLTRRKNPRFWPRHSRRQAGQHPSSCEIIYAPKQFSWTNGYRGRRIMTETNTTKQCMVASKEALAKGADGWDHYHSIEVHPPWRRDMRFTKQIGRHLFYSQDSLVYADSPGGTMTTANAASTDAAN